MLMRGLILATALAGLLASSPAEAQEVIAECGASTGRALYLTPREIDWAEDRISSGRYKFTVDGAGNPNIIFTDATGTAVDAAADGGRLIFSRLAPDRNEFGVVLIYPSTGVVETYNVLTTSDGRRRLLWSSNKPRIGAVELSKVGAYTADCG